MKNPHIALAIAAVLGLSSTSFGTIILSDNFDRSNSPTVGNGWIDSTDGGQLIISGERLSANQANFGLASGGIYRAFAFTESLDISMDITPLSGFGGLNSRFDHMIKFRSNGDAGQQTNELPGSGYAISIFRSDQNFNNSRVRVYDDGILIGEAYSSFQFQNSLHSQISVSTDGQVAGSITENGNSFHFAFGAHSIQSSGSFLTLAMGLPDYRSSTYIFPTINNFQISTSAASSVPEQGSLSPFLLTVLSLFSLRLAAIRGRFRTKS